MEGIILCMGSLVAMVLIIAILSKAVNNHDRNSKPVFGRLIINLQDPEADMFKLEIDIDDPNVLLQAKQVTLNVIELAGYIILQFFFDFCFHKYHPFKNI